MREADKARVRAIAARTWTGPDGQPRALLSDEEVYNLTISRGTLTPEERAVINHHIVATISMLESLPYPRHLARVPEFAGGHHEHMDGTGYPRGLTRGQMSVQARVMAIADVFEALTAGDRPYKKAMKLSQALSILGRMCEQGKIDPDLFQVFIRERVYQRYADTFLDPEQIDVVDVNALPGYAPAPADTP
jgi:HD-GYP domain-containing protein (c-di-GMP phosphodiesterase class II)